MDSNHSRSLALRPAQELTTVPAANTRILAEMVESSLELARINSPASVDFDALVREGKRIQKGEEMTPENIQAFKLFYQAATAGHSKAQFLVSSCYKSGRGVGADETQYLSWLRKSAESGNSSAQHRLGILYRQGENEWSKLDTIYRQVGGVQRNDEEAVKWLLMAASQGNKRAQYHLGICYAKGQGVQQNDQEAVKWWRRSAVLRLGLYQLGICYAYGRGVPQDLVEGYKWLRLAIEDYRWSRGAKESVSKSENDALAKAAALEALMSPSEIEAAFALCRDYEEKERVGVDPRVAEAFFPPMNGARRPLKETK